jgi:hypothetical protein
VVLARTGMEVYVGVAGKAKELFRWTKYPPDMNRESKYTGERVRPWHAAAREHAPHTIREAYSVHPADETDWTVHHGDTAREEADREIRNGMIKNLLTAGTSVQYRSTGNSLAPVVYSGDVTMWEPVTDHSELVVGEIVWCSVQPGNRYYGHAIHTIGDWYGKPFWEIGNLKEPPNINGWCYAEHIYGVLMEVSGVQPTNTK